MSTLNSDIIERIEASVALELDDATIDLHLARIEQALTQPAVTPQLMRLTRWRLRFIVAAVLLLAAIPSLAFAAEDAVPGDFLYPVKLVTEPVRSLLDDDVSATNRVEELDRLVQLPAPEDTIAEAVEDARDAVSELPSGHPLRSELDRITDRMEPNLADARPQEDRPLEDSQEPQTRDKPKATTTVPEEGTRQTTTTSVPETRDSTTTTAPAERGDEPPPEGDGRGGRDG